MLRELQADIAAVFHWQPSEMRRLPLGEAIEYRRLAVRRAVTLRGGTGRR